jgi:hypothetical protein
MTSTAVFSAVGTDRHAQKSNGLCETAGQAGLLQIVVGTGWNHQTITGIRIYKLRYYWNWKSGCQNRCGLEA